MAKQIADGIVKLGSETRLQDGVWQGGGSFLISDQSKLASIPDAEPGDMAFTAGFKHMWQLDTDGSTWVSIV